MGITKQVNNDIDLKIAEIAIFEPERAALFHEDFHSAPSDTTVEIIEEYHKYTLEGEIE